MKFIIKNGEIDRYATEDEFIDLRGTIVDDIRRILLYLERCIGDSSELVKLLDIIRKVIYNSDSRYIDSLISLTDDYVAFNLLNPKGDEKGTNCPDAVIIKRNMGGIYFIYDIDELSVHFQSREYDNDLECLTNFKVKYYDISNFKVEMYSTSIEKYGRKDIFEPTNKTLEFVSEVDKNLTKVISFPNELK